jgi:hypothetical protein
MKKVVFLMEEKDRARDEYSSAIIWWYGILEKLGYEVTYYDYLNFNFDNFYKEIKDFKPDFIFHPTYDKIHTEFIKLQELAKTYVIHSDDDYRFDQFAKFWIPFVDGTISFCGGEDHMKQLYHSAGCNDKTFIKAYWCFNPNTMAHNHKFDREFILSHLGSIYGERLNKLKSFSNYGIETHVFQNKFYSEFKEIAAKSCFSISLTKSSNLALNQIKGRIFEIPFSCILLTEPFPDMEKFYDLEKEIVVFNSIEEACSKIKNILSNEHLFSSIYSNGRKRLLSEHTSYHVWNNKILPVIDNEYESKDVDKILKEEHGL